MEKCLKMPGGGPFQLAPGQITDDSELAMMMMHGLVNNSSGNLVLDNIAQNY